MARRMIALFVAVFMLISYLPVSVTAEDDYLYGIEELPEVMPEYPSNGQRYWIIFNEGFRSERLEMSTFDVSENAENVRIIWNGNCKASVSSGQISRCNQYVYTEQEWVQIGDYSILTDKATRVFASNADVYDSEGNLLYAAQQYDFNDVITYDGTDLYKDLIDMYYDQLLKGWPDLYDLHISPKFYQPLEDVNISDPSEAGFVFYDLDHDGVTEIIFSSVEDASKGMIYDIYSWKGGQPVQMASSVGYRGQYYLREDHYVYISASGGAAYHYNNLLKTMKGNLVIAKAAWMDGEDQYYIATEAELKNRFTNKDDPASVIPYMKQATYEEYAAYAADMTSVSPAIMELTTFEEYADQRDEVPTEYNDIFHFTASVPTNDICYYSDSFFDKDSFEYQHDMALFSMAACMTAFNTYRPSTYSVSSSIRTYNVYDEQIVSKSPAVNAYELMKNCGYSDIAISRDYLINTEFNGAENQGHTLGVVLGHKTLEDGSTVIFEVLRGGGYGDEWIGNFTMYGLEENHTGFNITTNLAEEALKNYVREKNITGQLKIWLTGFSRAAITSNMLAAKLCRNEVQLPNCSVAPRSVYAYTFETPQGTKRKDIHDEKYSGIWNFVNPLDLVPKVSLSDWGYGRYGNTLVFPCKYTNHQYYEEMQPLVVSLFNDLTGSNYEEIPHLYMQNCFGDILTGILAKVLMADFTPPTQAALGILRTAYMITEDQSGSEKPEKQSNKVGEQFAESVVKMIEHMRTTSFGAQIIDTLLKAAQLYNIQEDIDSLIQKFKGLGYAHYPELAYSWMSTFSIQYPKNLKPRIKYILTNCPVNIAVYDEHDVLQLVIKDKVVYPEEDSYIEAAIDMDDQMIICVPEDVKARIEIIGTDTGTFNYSIQDYDVANDIVERVQNYFDIPIADGTQFTGIVDDQNCELRDGNGQTIEADETIEEDVPVYSIHVTSEGNGTITGSDSKVRGEYAEVSAYPGMNAEFLGWFDENGSLISEETVYRFRVDSNVELLGKFTGNTPSLKLNHSALSIQYGKSEKLSATGIDANAHIVYTSSNTNVATVSEDGTVIARNVGKAVISAYSENSSDQCDVLVLFSDVANNKQYFYEPVYWALNNGITVGAGGPGKFSPSASCTREQFVTFLWRQQGKPSYEKGCDFSDVPEDAWYYEPISWAAENGITTGLNDGTGRFGVGQACTREQCVTFLHRAADTPEPEGSIEFTDSQQGRYYYKAIKWAAGKGITVGLNDGTGRFGVGQKCTRGMLVTFLYRYDQSE